MKEYFQSRKDFILASILIVSAIIIIINFDKIIAAIFTFLAYFRPLYIGIIIAYVLNLPMRYFENLISKYAKEDSFIYRIKRTLAITITLLIVIIIIYLILIFILPQLFTSLSNLLNNIGSYLENFYSYLNNILAYLKLDAIKSLSPEELLNNLGLNYQELITWLSSLVLGTGGNLLMQIISASASLFNFCMSILIAIYLLASKEQLLRQTKMVIQAFSNQKYCQLIFDEASNANQTFSGFIITKGFDVGIQFIMMYFILSILQQPFALLIATICAIFAIVPVFGPLVAEIISILLLIGINPLSALIFLIVHQIVMNIESNIIYPRFATSFINLPPVWILTVVIASAYMGGPLWILLSVPFAAYIYNFLARYIKNRLERKGETI